MSSFRLSVMMVLVTLMTRTGIREHWCWPFTTQLVLLTGLCVCQGRVIVVCLSVAVPPRPLQSPLNDGCRHQQNNPFIYSTGRMMEMEYVLGIFPRIDKSVIPWDSRISTWRFVLVYCVITFSHPRTATNDSPAIRYGWWTSSGRARANSTWQEMNWTTVFSSMSSIPSESLWSVADGYFEHKLIWSENHGRSWKSTNPATTAYSKTRVCHPLTSTLTPNWMPLSISLLGAVQVYSNELLGWLDCSWSAG